MHIQVQNDCKRTKYLLLNIVLLLILILYIAKYNENSNFDVESDPKIYYWQTDLLSNNISCVYENGDALPVFDDTLTSPEKSIYFIETSCRDGLNSREACAVESAARIHPNWQVNVLFASPTTTKTLKTGLLALLKEFTNVKLMRVHINFTKDYKPLADLIIQQSLYPSEELSHLLRYITLRKWGGIYLDFDIITVRSLESLPKNWVARENDNSIGSAILAFAKDNIGRNFSEAILRETNASFTPNNWSYKGSEAITNVFRNKCTARKPVDWSARTCQDFNVLETALFYPLSNSLSKFYLKSSHLNFGGVYTHHLWNSKTKGEIVYKKSPYAKLARRYCPKVYKMFGESFASDGI